MILEYGQSCLPPLLSSMYHQVKIHKCFCFEMAVKISKE